MNYITRFYKDRKQRRTIKSEEKNIALSVIRISVVFGHIVAKK